MTIPPTDLEPQGDSDEDSDQSGWDEAVAALESRATAAGLKCKAELDSQGDHLVTLAIPMARESRELRMYNVARVRSLLDVPFERYRFLSGLNAVWSPEDDRVEGLAESLTRAGMGVAYRRLTGKSFAAIRANPSDAVISLPADASKSGATAKFGPPSDLLSAMTGRGTAVTAAGLVLEGFGVKTHDQAKTLLERVANSLFFEMDHAAYVALALSRTREATANPVPVPSGGIPALQFPRFQYDQEPIALYWYGRSAQGMPLLQFLAYYQVLEFYFPVFSRVEAQRRVRNLLKEPAFDPMRDADISRLLTAVRVGGGRSFGNEREQLRATMVECVSEADLREYIAAVPERLDFLSKKSDILGVPGLPLKAPSTDIRVSVADRVYDIRCKIVHTKATSDDDGQFDLLLPFSREAEALSFDIGLVQFAARKALIATSGPLRLSN